MSADLPSVDSGWNYYDPSASEANFRDLIERGRSANDQAYVAEASTQLARSIGMQRRFEQALRILDEAKAMLTDDMTRAHVRVLLERGRVANSSGNPGDSVTIFERAFELAKSASLDGLAVDAAHMLGIVEVSDRSMTWNERGIAIGESSTDPKAKRWLGPIYNNLAWTHNNLGRHEEALALFEKDVTAWESAGRPFEASIAVWAQGTTLRMMGQVDRALAIQESLLNHPDRRGKPAEGFTHEEIGECLILLGRDAEAAPHFRIAFERLDDRLQGSEPDRLTRIKRLAGLE